MEILIVSATRLEIEPLIRHLEDSGIRITDNKFNFNKNNLTILISGVGMMAMSYTLGNVLANKEFGLVIQAGIAGTFDRSILPGEVVSVVRDRVADLGTENADCSFSDVFEMGLAKSDSEIYDNGWISPITSDTFYTDLKQVTSVTVNKVTGCTNSIEAIKNKYNPDLESMEGAALFYACRMASVPCLQIRSVSNYVEPRNRQNWQIGLAIANLNKTLIGYLTELGSL